MVSGNDVYVTGFQERASGNYKAIYWKNGSPVVLSDTSVGAIAYGIAVSGTDVYVSGTVGDMITYWKNGIPVYLHDRNESVSVGIAGYNGDVYVCGSYYDNYVVGGYWKNNNFVPVNGASEDVYVSSILVTGQ
jgi:hypothetical protein